MKNIVTVGGGSGSYTLLRGLKSYPLHLRAIVTSFDSGGSSGVLRDEFGVLPPGDVRRSLVALSDESKESLLRDLFSFRFESDGALSGHSFGNLFLTALGKIRGDYEAAIRDAGVLLNISGEVIPVSLERADVCVLLEDGTTIKGETAIDIPKHDGNLKIEKVYLDPRPNLNARAKDALEQADYVVIGPGDLFTSIMPNVLVEGFREAISRSKAKIVYIPNLMTKWGETQGYQASDFAKVILEAIGREKFDVVVMNTTQIPVERLWAYTEKKQYPVVFDEAVYRYAKRVVSGDLVSDADLVRHDSEKLAQVIVSSFVE